MTDRPQALFEDGWEHREADAPPIDPAALAARLAPWLDGAPIVRLDPAAGGLANSTWRIEVAGRGAFAVRMTTRDPRACRRELALDRALPANVPRPAIVHADPQGDPPLTVARWLPGIRLWDALPDAGRAATRTMGRSIGEALFAIGTLRFDQTGFFDDQLGVREPLGPWPEAYLRFVAQLMEEGAEARLGPELALAARRIADARAPHLAALDGTSRLVHADFKGSNLLVAEGPRGWALTGVLDWEFSFAGHPLFDAGQLLRWEHQVDPAFEEGFVDGYRDAGGELFDGWRELARTLDLMNLLCFLIGPEERPNRFRAVRDLVRRTVVLSRPAASGT